jgi:hypothetical protein
MAQVLIESIFKGATDYVAQHVIVTNPKAREINITYVYYTYDLIDKDLDFDEEYHVKLMDNLRKMLLNEGKQLVEDGEWDYVEITCAKLIMKGDAKIEYKMAIDGTSCNITSY